MSEETKLILDDPFVAYADRARDRWLAPYMMSVEGLIADHNRDAIPFEPRDTSTDTGSTSNTYTPWASSIDYRTIDLDELILDRQAMQAYDLVETLIKRGFTVTTSPDVHQLEVVLPASCAEALAAVNRDQSKLWEMQSYMAMLQSYSPDDFRRLYECHWDFDGTVKPGRY